MPHKILIIYAHPNPKSFNHAILETVEATLQAQGAEARVRDLYAMGFDPVLRAGELANRSQLAPDVAAAQEDIRWADTLIFIYPIWWTDRPAILKGWFDRVFTNGFAFSTKGGVKGLLSDKRAIVLQTAGGSEADMKTLEPAIHQIIREGTLAFAGITQVKVCTFYGVISETDATRQEMLERVRAALA